MTLVLRRRSSRTGRCSSGCALPGWSSVSFVRPAHGLIALHGPDIVEIEALGLQVERHVVPPAEVAAAGMRSCTNLIVRQHFGSATAAAPGTVLALNAHGDVVPPGSGWSVDPYAATVRDGVMLGRGVAVSKSDFASYVWVLLALREAGVAILLLSEDLDELFVICDRIAVMSRGRLTEPLQVSNTTRETIGVLMAAA